MITLNAKNVSMSECNHKQNKDAAVLEPSCFRQCGNSWYAAYVRSRHEKTVAAELSAKSITNYLPLVERLKKWSDRKRLVSESLFKGYVFVNIPSNNRGSVLETRGVIRLVGTSRKPWPIPPEEIEAIYKMLNTNLRFDPYPYLKVGNEVCIIRGPLQGSRGILVEKNKKHRIVLSVHTIGQSIAIEIDAKDVSPL